MPYLLLAYYRDSLQQSTKRDDMHVVGVLDADFRELANPKVIVDTAFKASVLKREGFDCTLRRWGRTWTSRCPS